MTLLAQRYQQRRTSMLTTNLAFQDGPAIYPNAAHVVTLSDRLVHRAEIQQLSGKSYRNKGAMERVR